MARLRRAHDHQQREKALDTFSPREIQARVRAGASAEAIADDTGWPLDKVLRYAEPLLAERAYIAEQACAVEVRRSGGGSTLEQTAVAVIGGSDTISWDARRRDDGKWIVSASYPQGKSTRIAEWTYDHQGRNLHPRDDAARALMGVTADGQDESGDSTVEALELIAERPARRSRPRLVAVRDEPDAGSARAETVTIPHPSTAEPDDDEPEVPAQTPGTAAAGTSPKLPPARASRKPAPKSKRGRASVPSWDEILFGSGKTDE